MKSALFLSFALVVLEGCQRFAGQRIEHENVKDRHQSDTQVAQIPDHGVGGQSADKEHDEGQNLVDGLCRPVIAEQVRHVGTGIEQDADKCGETEQPDDDGDENDAELTQMVLHGSLQKIHAFQTGGQTFRRQQHDHGGTAADHDGVDEDAEGLREADLRRMVRLRGGCRAWGGTGTGFIGEESPLHTVHDNGSETAGGHLTQSEGFGENAAEDGWQYLDIDDDENDRHQQVDACHDRNHDIQDFDRGVFAKDDDRAQNNQHHRCVDRRDVECIFKSGGHGVADHLTDAEPADQAGEGKQDGQRYVTVLFAAFFFKKSVDIVGWAAPPAAVERVFLLIELCKRCLNKCGGRSDDGGNPHPEHSARATGGYGGNHAHQIAHAHAGGGGYDQCLQNGQCAVLFIFLTQNRSHHVAKEADRKHTGTDGEKDSRGNQKNHQNGQRKCSAAGQGDGK